MATKKPTKDEQIKSLQRQRDDLLETAELQQQQLNKLRASVEEEYINSPSYVQMQEEIKRLQGLREADEMIIKQQRETIERYKAEVVALRKQSDQGAGQVKSVHNARGAGRKPDLAKRQFFAQLYAAGADMDTIMEQMHIGRRTYYRYLAVYRKNVNN